MAQQKTHWLWDVAVLWPFIFIASLMVFGLVGMAIASMDSDASAMLVVLIPFVFLYYIASIVIMIVTYVYAIHRLYTRTTLSVDQKKTWLILIMLFNFITIPILHFMHLRVK
ncbi:MAG: hypothetical protein WCT24_03030 [Patescibacteria group bacterium]|jgi:hypothetical protein